MVLWRRGKKQTNKQANKQPSLKIPGSLYVFVVQLFFSLSNFVVGFTTQILELPEPRIISRIKMPKVTHKRLQGVDPKVT